jgi:DNA repair photolyase
MIVRDVDVLAEAARRASVEVTFSVPTLDREIWRRTEPGTAPPHQRLRALKELVDSGIKRPWGWLRSSPG